MNREMFEARVMELMRPLYYMACTLLSDRADREDALQSCLEKGLRKCASLRDETRLKTWITRILINECYSLLRSKRRMVPTEDVGTGGVEDGVDVGLRDAVNGLPEKLRLPLLLQLEGYGVREIAQVLRVPEGTVKHRLRAAKQQLREALSDGEEVSL